jgi:hypothetical protein
LISLASLFSHRFFKNSESQEKKGGKTTHKIRQTHENQKVKNGNKVRNKEKRKTKPHNKKENGKK